MQRRQLNARATVVGLSEATENGLDPDIHNLRPQPKGQEERYEDHLPTLRKVSL